MDTLATIDVPDSVCLAKLNEQQNFIFLILKPSSGSYNLAMIQLKQGEED